VADITLRLARDRREGRGVNPKTGESVRVPRAEQAVESGSSQQQNHRPCEQIDWTTVGWQE